MSIGVDQPAWESDGYSFGRDVLSPFHVASPLLSCVVPYRPGKTSAAEFDLLFRNGREVSVLELKKVRSSSPAEFTYQVLHTPECYSDNVSVPL